MARLIKMSSKTSPKLYIHSREWMNIGQKNNMFYLDKSNNVKIAQVRPRSPNGRFMATAPATTTSMGSRMLAGAKNLIPSANTMKGVGRVGGAGLAAYYGSEYINSLYRGNNALSANAWKPEEFRRGVAALANAVKATKIEGISKSLSKELQVMMATIGELSGQMTKGTVGNAGPEMQMNRNVEQALRAQNTPLETSANWLPPSTQPAQTPR